MSDTAKIVRFHQIAGPLALDTLPMPQPSPGEVRLRTKAIGLNRVETLFQKGEYFVRPSLPAHIGMEASGIVEAVGEGVDPAWIGQRVSSLPNIDMATHGVAGEVAIVPETALVAMPADQSFESAAGMWMAYLTAYGAIVPGSQVKPGDFVLINAASSSVGLAALQIIRALGAKSIAITRTASKRGALEAQGADHVVVTGEEDLIARVAEITGGAGARLALDCVAGKGVLDLAKTVATGGCLVVMGFLGTDMFGYADGAPTPFPFLDAVGRNLIVRGYNAQCLMGDPAAMKEAQRFILAGMTDGQFTPRIDCTFPLDRIEDAYAYLQANGQVGKVVVTT